MNIINILLDFSFNCTNPCEPNYVKPIFDLIKTILNIIRIVVPIALIALTTFDVMKKVIDPNDKDGQKKIMIRAIAALIVFLIPTMISITLKLIDSGDKNKSRTTVDAGLSECWESDDIRECITSSSGSPGKSPSPLPSQSPSPSQSQTVSPEPADYACCYLSGGTYTFTYTTKGKCDSIGGFKTTEMTCDLLNDSST